MNALHKISLYYSEGSSNKEYHAEIIEAANGSNVVNFRYGRRGGALTSGVMVKSGVWPIFSMMRQAASFC
jgi:bifunctional non-homologous end joining protein LigD